MGDIVGVVLGAGSSRRLGRPKQTLPFGDRSLLAHVVREAEDSCLDRVVVVLGGGGAAAQLSLAPGRARVVRNDAYPSGCASSLQTGLDAAGACDAIVLLLGDMPGVDAEVIDEVVDAWSEDPTWAAVASYRDEIGHPFLFSVGAFATLRGLHGDKAIWKIVDREPEDRVARLPVDRLRPEDIDTWDDYLRACDSFGFIPAPPLP
jgi:molybdenum cofactor cytidylyltransferase